ncbi:MAG: hypothetical protein ACRDOU_31980 [Streptosporangiaceae bacterium]
MAAADLEAGLVKGGRAQGVLERDPARAYPHGDLVAARQLKLDRLSAGRHPPITDAAARIAPVAAVLYAAADGDPDAADLLAEAARGRMFGARAFVAHLASLDALAAEVSEQQAADLCWALMDGHLYRLLVGQRGWTTAEFERWLTAALAATLLRP